MPEIILEESWKTELQETLNQPFMKDLFRFLMTETQHGKTIYPQKDQVFSAFTMTPFNAVKVVILGQDPYHGPGQAHGLSFSVPETVKTPPSLANIYKELKRDLSLPIPKSGCLTSWAEQGVLLLNSVLTVEQGKAGSHQGKGWEKFTDAAIAALNNNADHLVFLLWGAYAQKKGKIIDRKRHLVLNSPHPSPLSAHRGFIGNSHFSQANEYLIKHFQTPIDWSIKDQQDKQQELLV
ncbi:uracil-DNA glycosylase [Sneathiella aquimaris]|uniref:uracil-DNA glycosylase n=1 Tax=Sneathiella aquimaris TaxID=2599305 RepID=UPI00146CBEB3|nr:uracil-DNA glycosylase [Sneathiella aquimaris]